MLDDAPTDNSTNMRDTAPPLRSDRAKPPTAPVAAATPKRSLSMQRRSLLAAAVLIGVAVGGYMGVRYWTVGRFMVTTDDAYVGARPSIIAPKIAGYIKEIAVADNAAIKTGDLIARIDPGDYELAVRAARDQVATQQSTIARIGQQITALQAATDQSRSQAVATRASATKAELDFKRQSELAARQINSAAAFDQARAARDQAVANVSAADAAIAAAVANVAVAAAQRTEAENVLKQYQTSLAKSERDLSFAEVRAPFDGVLGNRAMQVGDYVQASQRLASLVPLKDVYIDANFKETQLSRLKPGQPVKIAVDAHDEKTIEGRVVSVSPASGSVFSLLPPDNATGNFTKVVQRLAVRISIPDTLAAQSILRPGMSVIVSVDTKPPAAATPTATANSAN